MCLITKLELVRELVKEDFEELIDFLSSLDEETNKFWNHLLTDPTNRAKLFMQENSDKIIAVLDEEIVGFAYLTHHPDYPRVPALGLVVRSTHRNMGIGTALMIRLLEMKRERGYRKIYLATHKSNVKAFEFYKKHGFKVIGEDEKEWKMEHD